MCIPPKKEKQTEGGKPGSCVSLLAVTRTRTRRGPKPRPCSDAARFHVSFHDKHTPRRPRTLAICPADDRLRLEARRRRGGNDIYGRKRRVTCVIFSSLPSSSGSLALAASNRAQTTPNSLRWRVFLGFGFRPGPVTPGELSSYWRRAVPRWVLSSKTGGLCCLSLAPRFCCWKCVISPSHHRRIAHYHAVEKHIFRAGLRLILGRKKNVGGGGWKWREKRTWPRREIPRNVSTFLAGEKAKPPLSGSVFIAYIRPA